MARLLWISPSKLFAQSFLAGSIFVFAALVLLVDLTLVALRGYAFNLVSNWGVQDGLSGLEGISFSILVAQFWYITQIFLLADLICTLLLPSRDLQEGAVIAWGIISLMQIPLVTLYLKYELSFSNQLWLVNACHDTDYADSCPAWWTGVRIVSVTSDAIGCFLHLLLLVFCARYVHMRPATSLDMIARRKTRSKRTKKVNVERPQSAPVPPPFDPYLSESEDDLFPPVNPKSSKSSSVSTAPPFPHAAMQNNVHTDSESDAEKKLLDGAR